ncbi:MAG: glycoside hydrolase family 31 protein [Ruminococcaceae bacterium]|nr:glycoside hydrolase family 31 protein [Oscillospiraceae bacterium]
MTITLSNNTYDISSPTVGAIRIRKPGAKFCGLDRYNITHVAEETALPVYECNENELIIKNDAGDVIISVSILETPTGWQVSLPLTEDEQLYGLGDINRTRFDKRGHTYRAWVVDVARYMPIPYLMSSEGWAIGINTTFEHFYDVGNTDKDKLKVTCRYETPDITIYTGKDYAELLYRYTSVTGRPTMLPKWAMGLTFVCNQQADATQLISDCRNFRYEDIPCDIIGLEPGWMETDYDLSTEKKWHPQRFYIPFWTPNGASNFFRAVERLQFKLSLWLCCEYDLFYYEEKLIRGNTEDTLDKYLTIEEYEENSENEAFEDDQHLKNDFRMMDTITKPDEPWFEHLKKFVDQGAACFKLDGAYQVMDHPDRRYGNGMLDEEAHNLYPVVYAKQMSLGYSDYTGKRSMIYTVSGYTGIQQYAATWAGDTGGGFGPLVSMMNNGLCGHSNTSCDMDAYSIEGIHFGFLMPWAQLNSWAYWRHPWFLTDEMKAIFRDYDKLRYSLVPYLYTAAYQAWSTGMPVMRALPVVFPGDKGTHERLSQYMLGDSLLVGVFLDRSEKTGENGEKTNFYLPAGEVWYDFFTGEKYEGGQEIFYVPQKGKGGALFVKGGSAIPFAGEERQAVGDKPYESYIIRAWGDNATGMLYDDDGISFGYRNGEGTISNLSVVNGELKVETTGSYPGMPEKITYTLGEIVK